MPLFRFVQAEFPFPLGPEDGRYVLRGHAGEPSHILVLSTLGARQRRLLRGRRAKDAAPEPEPEPVPTSRVTLIGAEPVAGEEAGRAWLAGADLEHELAGAVETLNGVLHAHRVAAADPHARDVAREQALVARVGLGDGEQVVHGRWAAARELPVPHGGRRSRSAALRPQERLAAILGTRDVALACEELTLRARLDVDRGRHREAAFQLRVALEAAIAELAPWADRPGMAERLEALHAERGAVGAAANAALQGGLDDAAIAGVTHALERIEAALRARSALGFD